VSGIAWTPPSWDEIVREHSSRVYRLAFRSPATRTTRGPHQEVFVRCSGRWQLPAGTFELAAPHHHQPLLDQARRRQRIRFEGLADDAAERLHGHEPTPAQAYDDKKLDADVQAALEGLAPDYRRSSCSATSRACPMRRSRRPSA